MKTKGYLPLYIIICIAILIVNTVIGISIDQRSSKEKAIENQEKLRQEQAKKEKEQKDKEKDTNNSKSSDDEYEYGRFRITKVQDLGDDIINKLNQYACDDINAGFGNIGDFGNNMDYLLETVTKNNPKSGLNDIIYSTSNYYYIHEYNVELMSIDLFSYKKGPQNSYYGPSTGLVKLNYRLDIDLDWIYCGSIQYDEPNRFTDTVYVSYVWDVDLFNTDMPIKDFGKYKFDYSNGDLDYDNWYNKNIVSEKSDYNVDEWWVKR